MESLPRRVKSGIQRENDPCNTYTKKRTGWKVQKAGAVFVMSGREKNQFTLLRLDRTEWKTNRLSIRLPIMEMPLPMVQAATTVPMPRP